jgi:galactosyl transferase GMA12/MNN10 family
MNTSSKTLSESNIRFDTIKHYNCCILMWYDSKISCYGDINYKINKTYCDKHNIDIICCHERRHPTRHPAWERIPLILKHINNYDYVIWIDADAHFYIDSENLVNLIRKYDSYDFIFSNDKLESIQEGMVGINTGIYIVKNTPYSTEFLLKWGYDDVLHMNNRVPYWWDQGVLIDIYQENILDIQNHSIIIDYGILQHFHEYEEFDNKPFIFHLAGVGTSTRYEHSFKYMTTVLNIT